MLTVSISSVCKTIYTVLHSTKNTIPAFQSNRSHNRYNKKQYPLYYPGNNLFKVHVSLFLKIHKFIVPENRMLLDNCQAHVLAHIKCPSLSVQSNVEGYHSCSSIHNGT